jgi:hypothetical protein
VVTKGFDPGLRLNDDDLKEFYKTAGGSTFAADLVNVRVSVGEHGELGPVLHRDDDNLRDHLDASSGRRDFTEWKRPEAADQRESIMNMIAASTRAIELLEKAKADKDGYVNLVDRGQPKSVSDFDTAIKFHKALIARYSKSRLTA